MKEVLKELIKELEEEVAQWKSYVVSRDDFLEKREVKIEMLKDLMVNLKASKK